MDLGRPRNRMRYVCMRGLGVRRKKVLQESPNTGLRNESFRNYAAYMMTDEFAEGIGRLLEIASRSDLILPSPRADDKGGAPRSGTAIMCAERVYFQCHRMLVSDYLVAHGHSVLHIDDEKQTPRKHTLMAEAQLVEGKLVYDGGRLL